MSLPTPKLDDRTYKDLLEDAIKQIPAKCPDWTDFNPSDPGITMLDLMAWMCETVLYRLNRVPDKNYIKFLELMGIKLMPAQPARTWVEFKLARGAKEEDLPQISVGYRIATKPGNGEQSVDFETCDPLNLTASQIIAICSQSDRGINNHYDQLQPDNANDIPKAVKIFCGETQVSHFFYFGAARLTELKMGHKLLLSVELAKPLLGKLCLEWEAWDGESWITLIPQVDETQGFQFDGQVVFDTLSNLVMTTIQESESSYLRIRLADTAFESLPVVKHLKYKVELTKTAEKAYFSTDDDDFAVSYLPQPVDLNRTFHPFGKSAKQGNIFYIGSSLFKRSNSRIFITVAMSEALGIADSSSGNNIGLVWEYFKADEGWKPLGEIISSRVTGSEFNLEDGTDALTHSGTVAFDLPPDIAFFSGLIEAGNYVRVKLISINFKEEDSRKLLINKLSIRLEAKNYTNFAYYISDSYGKIVDLTSSVNQQKNFPLFVMGDCEFPSFYLSFNSRPANVMQRIYIQLEHQEGVNPLSVTWQYRTKGEWKNLEILADGTRGFSQKGGLEFLAPIDWEKDTVMFKTNGYWLRANWIAGERLIAPELKAVYPNAVEVIQACSKEKNLGSSNGQPFQSFAINEGSILPGTKIKVREIDHPSPEDIARLKNQLREDVIEEVQDSTVTALWSQWREVDNFFHSGPDNCHYTLDLEQGIITFGDGKFGQIPPTGRENIVVDQYYVGGGVRGNVGRNTITVMNAPYPFVQSVRNIEPAVGGADGETIEMAKLRGPWALKHRDRAITQEDFEKLAKESSTEVGLATCITEGSEIQVIVMPAIDTDKPRPTSRLIEIVKEYLDKRRLLTTQLRVVGPEYDDIVMNVNVRLTTSYAALFPQVKEVMHSKLRQFVHPLKGGADGIGWPMGRSLYLSEIYYLLESIEGIEYIDEVRMRKNCASLWEEKKIPIGEKSFPYFRRLEIIQV